MCCCSFMLQISSFPYCVKEFKAICVAADQSIALMPSSSIIVNVFVLIHRFYASSVVYNNINGL